MPDYWLVVAEIVLAASGEMAEAAAWYDERISGLGERFLGEAESRIRTHRRDAAKGPRMCKSIDFVGWGSTRSG